MDKNCEHCGALLVRRDTELEKHFKKRRFCGKSCSSSFVNRRKPKRKADKLIEVACLNCGKKFSYRKSCSNGKFCSCKCAGEHIWETVTKPAILEGKRNTRKTLKKFLIERDGNVCACCGISEWMGKSLSLEVDHINGDPSNNMPDNLRLLCPNCHSQTEFFCGKNKGRGRGSKGISIA